MSQEERVFHIVDGVVVPKSDNRQIPGRRYGLTTNVTTGETRLIEYSEEEEAQRDAEEQQWETDAPKREAEAEQRRVAAEAYRASLQYEERIVAFIDVLGWRAAVQRSVAEPELVRTLGLGLTAAQGHVYVNDWIQNRFPDQRDDATPRITQFSDSLIISVQPSPIGVARLTGILHSLSMTFMSYQLWLRGGIAIGPMYHQKNLAFGPAMIEAYDLEHDHAVVPRIILSDKLAEGVGPGAQIASRTDEPLSHFKTWRRDSADGRRYFDFLQPIGATTMPGQYSLASTAHFAMARNAIERGLGEFTDEKIHLKYRWLADYFNSVIAEYPDTKIAALR